MEKDGVSLKVEASTRQAQKSMDALTNSVNKTKSSISLMLSTLNKMTRSIVQITNYTDEYINSMTLLNSVFDKTIDNANNFVSSMSEMTGIKQSTLNRQVALFGQLGKSINLSEQYTEKFAEGLTLLSTKLAMIYKTDFSYMASSLQRAIQGTQETLKIRTGIESNEIGEAAVLASYGINREVSSLNEAEMAIVRYATILRQVSNDNSVYADTVNSVAWQKQILSNQVKRLAEALGAVLYPILERILPILNAILMVITEIIMMLAKLVGFNINISNTTNSAADGFGNLAAGIGAAGKATKKQLRGFDKLNNITTPSGGAGGAGGLLGIDKSILGILDDVNKNMLDIQNKATEIRDRVMEWLGFTKEIDENGSIIGWKYQGLETTIKNIKDSWGKLNGVVKLFVGFGVALTIYNIWRAVKTLSKVLGTTGLIKIFKNLSTTITTKALSAFGKFSGVLLDVSDNMSLLQGGLLGALLTGGGFYLMFKMLQEMNTTGINLKNTIGLLAGAVGTFTGVVWLANTALTAFGIATGGIPILIGAIVTILGGLITANLANKDATDQDTASVIKFRDALKEVDENSKSNLETMYAQVGRAKELKNELLNLVDANGKVVGSQQEAETIITSLNNLLGTQYEITNGQISLDGKLLKGKDELSASVDRYCQKLRNEALLEVAREKYQVRMERQIELQKEIEGLTNDLTKAQENYDMTTQEGVLKFLSDHSDVITKLADLQSQLDNNTNEMENYEEAMYEASIGNFDKANELLTKTLTKVGTSAEDMKVKILDANKSIPEDVKTKVLELTKLVPVITVKARLDTTSYNNQLTSLRNSMAKSPTLSISGYASGGFPNEGELFMAREAGAELVGTMNGRTAVANNDQIVQGIQSGVFNGMMSALSNANLGSNITIEASGDDSGLLNFISFKQKQKDRQFAN